MSPITAAAVTGLGVLLFSSSLFAQSSLLDHPSPITRNEVEATIKARDIGDARLTTHYYWFDGAQGDVFINWTSKNFAGDVDLFIQNGLRTLSKIVVYADFGEVETGRVIYLRKPERLLLRVQGRTPNDDVATYRLKFAGSFVAATGDEKDIPVLPSVGEEVRGAVRVNSVGTKLPPLPKAVETKSAEVESSTGASEKASVQKEEAVKQVEADQSTIEEKKVVPKLEVVIEENSEKNEAASKPTTTKMPPRRARQARNAPVKRDEPKSEQAESAKTTEIDEKPAGSDEKEAAPASKAEKKTKAAPTERSRSATSADPLANVQLVIVFKDGSKIERPLPDVFRFSVDRGVLTVISKDGRVGKYQMINVAKVTIE